MKNALNFCGDDEIFYEIQYDIMNESVSDVVLLLIY